jgi:hypothetical protein
MAGVAGRLSSNVFREHVPLGRTDVTDQVPEREATGSVRPLQMFGRNSFDDAQGTSTDTIEVFEKRLNRKDLHGSLMM